MAYTVTPRMEYLVLKAMDGHRDYTYLRETTGIEFRYLMATLASLVYKGLINETIVYRGGDDLGEQCWALALECGPYTLLGRKSKYADDYLTCD